MLNMSVSTSTCIDLVKTISLNSIRVLVYFQFEEGKWLFESNFWFIDMFFNWRVIDSKQMWCSKVLSELKFLTDVHFNISINRNLYVSINQFWHSLVLQLLTLNGRVKIYRYTIQYIVSQCIASSVMIITVISEYGAHFQLHLINQHIITKNISYNADAFPHGKKNYLYKI